MNVVSCLLRNLQSKWKTNEGISYQHLNNISFLNYTVLHVQTCSRNPSLHKIVVANLY